MNWGQIKPEIPVISCPNFKMEETNPVKTFLHFSWYLVKGKIYSDFEKPNIPTYSPQMVPLH